MPVRNLRDRNLREGDPTNDSAMLARPSRSPAVRDARCLPTDYTRNLFRPDSSTYPLPHVTHLPYWHEREVQYRLHSRHPFEPTGTSSRVEETLQAYRVNDSLPPYDRLLSERVNRWSTSSNDDRSREGHPANSRHSSSRRRQAGLTRSLTERRPKVVRLDRNFRRSFTGRVEDYRMENVKRTNFSMETSL